MGNVLPHGFQTPQENQAATEETFRLCDKDRLSEVIRKLHWSIEEHRHSKQADTMCCPSSERKSHDSYPSSTDGDVPERHLHYSNRASPLPVTDKRQLHYRSHMYMDIEGLECILPDRMAQLEEIVSHHTMTVGPGHEEVLLRHLSDSTDALSSLFNELEIPLINHRSPTTSIGPSECEDLPIKLKIYTELLWLIRRQLYSRPFGEFKIGYFAQFAKQPIKKLVEIALLLSKMEWSVTDICPMMLAYEAVMDAVLLIQKLIPSESDDLFPKIKSNIWVAFMGIFDGMKISIQSGMGDPPGGAIHSATCSLVDSVKIFHSHKELVQSFAPDDDCHSFGHLLYDVIEIWISALKEHPIPDPRLKNIFILNNMSHLKGKTNGLLDELLPQQHIGDFNSHSQTWIQHYMASAWDPALSCLTRKYWWGSQHLSLVKFTSKFNKSFDSQNTWEVPDPDLREKLRRRIEQDILPRYTIFLDEYSNSRLSSCSYVQRYSAKKIHTTDSLQKMMRAIFEGGTGQPTSLPLSS